MELDSVKKFLRDKVKLSIIQGKITGVTELPTDEDIEREIDKIINNSKNGMLGSVVPFNRKDVSNSNIYNSNFLTIKDNIEYLLGDVYDNLNSIIDIVNDSILEKNQVLRDLKMIDRDFSDIEAGTLHNDGLKYVISDSFADTDKVDTLRTTANLNLNAGNVSLNTISSSYFSFPHYRNQAAINFTITEGFSQIVAQQQTPGTTFGSIFNNDDTDRWELVVTTSKPTTLEGYFSLKLSEIGEAVEINGINLKLFSTKDLISNPDLITIEYLNQDLSDRTWKILPGAKIDVTTPEISLSFPTIKTTHIRFTWAKFYPDNLNDMQYHFSITSLAVHKSSTSFESVLISNSLKIQPYQNEQPTIYVAELETKKQIQPGTSINFYVAVDDVIPGKVIDDDNNIVSIDSDGAKSFVPNGIGSDGKPENYYCFASDLRDRPYLTGVLPYQSWQPKWQQISPKDDTVKSIPNTIFFNISEFDNPTHDLYYTNPILWGDPSYTGPWPATGLEWADAWRGGTGTFPKSGYIWGDDPLTNAGVWWGDATEYPGWWRPSTPTSSGTYLDTPVICVPDFNIPVFDSSGSSVNGVQKHFWKIFKWPSTSLPIPGTVKISNKLLLSSNEVIDNMNVWKWNYKSTKKVDDYVINNVILDSNVNFFTIRLEEYLLSRSDIIIIPGSIRDVKFADVTPSEIVDFTVEYGKEYIKNDLTGFYSGVNTEEQFKDSHATIVFSDSAMNARRRGSNDPIHITFTLSYEAKDNISASWDGYLYVPSSVENLPKCHVNPGPGSIQKITIQQMSDTGLVQQSKEINETMTDTGEWIGDFSLFTGLNLTRVFVDVDVTQNDIIDDTIATWRPDQNEFTYSGGVYLYGINKLDSNNNDLTTISGFGPNFIKSSTINFVASGIYPGLKIDVEYDTLVKNVFKQDFKWQEVIISQVEEVDIPNEGLVYKISIIPSGVNEEYYIRNWNISNFSRRSGFSYDKNISAQNEQKYLSEVDINVLLHETGYDDDTRFALLDDVDGSKYVVIKTPESKTFPKNIVNSLHYNRTYWDYLEGRYITYTTGTSGNIGSSPQTLITNIEPNAVALVNNPPNTKSDTVYSNISTYGETVQVDEPSKKSFLFWDTAENIETVFDIKYSVAANNRPADRIMLMAKLISSDLSLSPVLNSYSLIINDKMKE